MRELTLSRSKLLAVACSGTVAIRILICDDHEFFRRGVVDAVSADADIMVIGTVASGLAALEKSSELEPNVLVLDLHLPEMDGIAVLEALRRRKRRPNVLVLSGSEDPRDIVRALRAGALGFALKSSVANVTIEAIKTVAAGRRYCPVSTDLLSRTANEIDRVVPGESETLDDRDLAVLRLLGRALTSREIARKLGLSERTIEDRRTRLRIRLKTTSDEELREQGLRRALVWLES